MPRPHRRLPALALPRLLALALTIALAGLLPARPAHAAPDAARPQLSLPTPPGERWRVLQGYACGTHNSWDRYSLDLVADEGRTYDAPVRAAADGTVFVWAPKSGTLILSHGGGFYTMYTHMASSPVAQPDRAVARGEVIGTVGDRGTRGNPHLHFTAFVADGPWAANRRSVPLSFVEGYDLPEIGGCSQHGGTVMVASGEAPDTAPPTIAALSEPIRVAADTAAPLAWLPAEDQGSGVAGYRIYLGPDPQGISDWYVTAPEAATPPLAAGSYLLRIQPIDRAGNAGAWTTVATVVAGG